MTEEIWKDIKGYEGIYKVSNFGRVKSLNFNNTKLEKIRTLTVNSKGYVVICLRKNGFKENKSIHRLVAEHFTPNPNNLPQVNHIDENKQNNNINNLEWCASIYNINYGNGITKRSNQIKKPLYQYDKYYNLIRKWDSSSQAEKEGNYSSSHISACCNGKRKYHKNYIWVFESEVLYDNR